MLVSIGNQPAKSERLFTFFRFRSCADAYASALSEKVEASVDPVGRCEASKYRMPFVFMVDIFLVSNVVTVACSSNNKPDASLGSIRSVAVMHTCNEENLV